jgi:MFS family permease
MEQRQWYYVKDGQQCGPIDEDGLVELFRQRALGPATQVWTQGMKDWCQASQMNWLVPLPTGPQAAPQYARPQRPKAVTVFGILNIVFGGLGLLCTPLGMCATSLMPHFMNPSGGAKAWMLFSFILGVTCAILLLAIGIGLLNLRPWARKWAIGYGWFAIVWTIIGTLISAVLTTSGAYGYSHDAAPGVVGGLLGSLVGLVYPILLIVFMRKPHVKDAFTE